MAVKANQYLDLINKTRKTCDQRGAFWAKAGHFWKLGGPEVVQCQSKVCGNHESNPGGADSGRWDQLWSPGTPSDPQGHQKGYFGPKLALFCLIWTVFVGWL